MWKLAGISSLGRIVFLNLLIMIVAIIYLIGVIIAFILGILLIVKEKRKDNLEYGMIVPLMLLSWISVIIILWRRDKLLT